MKIPFWHYSNLPNKRRASLNYFQPIFPPRRSYLAHFYNSLLNKTAGTFIYFLNFFPPRRLLSPVRLLSRLEYVRERKSTFASFQLLFDKFCNVAPIKVRKSFDNFTNISRLFLDFYCKQRFCTYSVLYVLHKDLETVGLENVEIWKSRKKFQAEIAKSMSFLTSAIK